MEQKSQRLPLYVNIKCGRLNNTNASRWGQKGGAYDREI